MVPELEKPRVTELHVRMDCNGCVQKIKKAMHAIDGVYDVYIDLAQQKLTVVGRADPEQIVRAIKKTRKIATICSHTEPGEPGTEPPPATEPAAGGDPPAPDAAPTSAEDPPAEANTPDTAPPQEKPAEKFEPSPEAKDTEPKDLEEIHMVHHYPHTYVYGEHWNNYPSAGHGMQREAPYYVNQSYNSYRPSPYVSGYYGYMRSPPREIRYRARELREPYSDDYYHSRGGGDGNNVTSIFSDENPNACSIS